VSNQPPINQTAVERLSDPGHGTLLPVHVADQDTQRAVQRLCHATARLLETVTYLLWLGVAVAVLITLLFAVAAVNGGIPR